MKSSDIAVVLNVNAKTVQQILSSWKSQPYRSDPEAVARRKVAIEEADREWARVKQELRMQGRLYPRTTPLTRRWKHTFKKIGRTHHVDS